MNYKKGDKITHTRYPKRTFIYNATVQVWNGMTSKFVDMLECYDEKNNVVQLDPAYCSLVAPQQLDIDFELVEIGSEKDKEAETIKLDTQARCNIGLHEEGMTPLQLSEYDNEWWVICKHCGTGVRPHDTTKEDPFAKRGWMGI
jgi:hypothetical protein